MAGSGAGIGPCRASRKISAGFYRNIIRTDPLSCSSLSCVLRPFRVGDLQKALDKARGNVSEAARLLKVIRNTLRYRMAKYNLKAPEE